MTRPHQVIDMTPQEGLTACILSGTITVINRETNEASILIDDVGLVEGIPIFYHCECYSDISHGAWAFKTEDEEDLEIGPWMGSSRVMILSIKNTAGILGDIRVFGFEDALPRYCFSCGTYSPSKQRGDTGKRELANHSDVVVTFQGGCPPFSWDFAISFGNEIYFENEVTEARVNILHVVSDGMCTTGPYLSIRVTDANLSEIICGSIIGCPDEVGIVLPEGSDPESRYVLMSSTDGSRYNWKCLDGCEGGGFYYAPNAPAIDGVIGYPCLKGVYWRRPERCVPQETTIGLFCSASGDWDEATETGKLMAETTVTSNPQEYELVYADTQVGCDEWVSVYLDPPKQVLWVIEDWDGNVEESFGFGAGIETPSSNADCDLGNITIQAFCVENHGQEDEIRVEIGSVSFHINCAEGGLVAYLCANEFFVESYGSSDQWILRCDLTAMWTSYDCLGAVVEISGPGGPCDFAIYNPLHYPSTTTPWPCENGTVYDWRCVYKKCGSAGESIRELYNTVCGTSAYYTSFQRPGCGCRDKRGLTGFAPKAECCPEDLCG